MGPFWFRSIYHEAISVGAISVEAVLVRPFRCKAVPVGAISDMEFRPRPFRNGAVLTRNHRNTKSNSIDQLYRPVNCICTEKIRRESRHLFFGWCWSKCDVTFETLAMAAIVCWQSEADCMESKSEQMCEILLIMWPCLAQQMSIVLFYAVTEIKGLWCRLRWMAEWRNLLTSTDVGHRLCHVGSREWRVTKIWGPKCERD